MKKVSILLFCVILMLQMSALFGVAAADSSGEYKPLDMVVVVDTSGSMNYSDSTHMTASSIKMLINMMPAEESRIGIVTFNTEATSITCDSKGTPTLLALSDFSNVTDVKQKVTNVNYNGGTGIGNALKLATDILSRCSNGNDRQKAIILFTDGMDDFGIDKLGLANCKENQSQAVQWATKNNCPIYCIGYDYQNSMGTNGEGIQKLESISKSTRGQAKAITNINEIEDLFVNMLANICNLHYKEIQTIPGDGKRHEIEIPIGPEVVEANVRITCSTKDALAKGKIELYNSQNEKIILQNGNGVRYDVDATAVSIKVLSPKPGTWKLVLDGIKGETIKIGLLEHYELGIVGNLVFPQGNPDGIAYNGDTIGVNAYLTTDGNRITDTAIYETVTTARVVVTPRANPEAETVYALTFDGQQYVGSFDITSESVYDVVVEIGSETFIRTYTDVIQSSNHPLVLDKEFENVKLNKNKQIVISDIYTYVSDPEQDKITAKITNSTDPDMAKVEVVGDTVVIDGLGWGATNATITFTDAHGNTVESTFKVSVNDPVAWLIIGIILFLIAVVIGLILYWLYRKTLWIVGKIKIVGVYEGYWKEYSEKPIIVKQLYRYLTDSSTNFSGAFDSSADAGAFSGAFDSSADAGAFSGAFDSSADAGAFGGAFDSSADAGAFGGAFDSSADAGAFGGAFDSSADAGAFSGAFDSSADAGAFGGAFNSSETDSVFTHENAEDSHVQIKFTPEEEAVSAGFSREIKLSGLGKKPSFRTVVKTFLNNLSEALFVQCPNGEKSSYISACADNDLYALDKVHIKGTSRGAAGIILVFPKKNEVFAYGNQIINNKLYTNTKKNEKIGIKLAIPNGKTYRNKKGCLYIECIYINQK